MNQGLFNALAIGLAVLMLLVVIFYNPKPHSKK